MSSPSPVLDETILKLPSDQDASGRTLGEEEIAAVAEAIRTGTLTSTKGQFVKTLETRFAALLGLRHAHACASGTAAVHVAIAAIDPDPGDEIVTSPVTDMGALTPILYQGAIPVFADVDPYTGNVTAESFAACISPKTKAIIVTHLFGNPCDMTGVMDVARKHNIPVIEDCAQAFLATHAGKQVGTFGVAGCFSLQQGKHITTGEGGVVVGAGWLWERLGRSERLQRAAGRFRSRRAFLRLLPEREEEARALRLVGFGLSRRQVVLGEHVRHANNIIQRGANFLAHIGEEG